MGLDDSRAKLDELLRARSDFFTLASIYLSKGKHSATGSGQCLMEAVSIYAGEPFTDQPGCVSPVLRRVGNALNDRLGDGHRQSLRWFIPRLPGTVDGLDEARAYLALDWMCRTFVPAWLFAAGFGKHADMLRALQPVTGPEAAAAVRPQLADVETLIGHGRFGYRGPAQRAARHAARYAVSAVDETVAGDVVDAARLAPIAATKVGRWSEFLLANIRGEMRASVAGLFDRMIRPGERGFDLPPRPAAH